MASYFRRQARPVVAPVEHPSGTSHPEAGVNPDERWAPTTSILIFPSPSSSIPPTPASSNGPLPHSPGSASMSNFSLPTSISVDSSIESASEKSTPSSYRRIRLKRQGQFDRPAGGTTTSGHAETRLRHSIPQQLEVDLESVSETTGDGNLEVELWEWSQSSSQVASPQDTAAQDRFLRSLHMAHYPGGEAVEISWPPHLRQRTISQFTNTSNISQLSYISNSTSSSQSPPTPLYFPFLSLIKQLFGIDSETIMLLGALGGSTSGAEADLFLSSPFETCESAKKTVSNISAESVGQTDESIRPPIFALLAHPIIASSSSTSAHSLKAGLRAAAEYQAGVEELSQSRPWSLLLSFPSGASGNIQDLLLSPVKLTSSLASGAINATTGMIGQSSSVMGTALSAFSKPVIFAAGAAGWGRGASPSASA